MMAASWHKEYAMGWIIQGSIPGTDKKFFSSQEMSTPALGPTQPPIQLVTR